MNQVELDTALRKQGDGGAGRLRELGPPGGGSGVVGPRARRVVTPTRLVPMSGLGSDENYLTLHVAFAFAFHRIFQERSRPVPGVLVFDQLSRPYYGDDADGREQPGKPGDREKLASYMKLVFDECARAEGLQVIVLEHARLYDNETYRAAVIEEWEEGNALIPEDWPTEE